MATAQAAVRRWFTHSSSCSFLTSLPCSLPLPMASPLPTPPALGLSAVCYTPTSCWHQCLCPSVVWRVLEPEHGDPFHTRMLAQVLRKTLSFATWEWNTGYQSSMDSHPAGPFASGVTCVSSTGKLSPSPEGALDTLLLWSPPTSLSTGHTSALNIQPTQMCTVWGISGDTRQRGDFTKQVGTGKRNYHISVCCVSHCNTGPQSMTV